IGYTGRFTYNTTKPDGTLRKLTDVSKLTALGWQAETTLDQGIKALYLWYIGKNKKEVIK
ncbi:MAG: GDP-L-fucose synthase, partial [Bacteroidia bacterium]|nr:GDP-L-fucose synthase [Bacteroidia bacterium]